jgi:hypothetical protein
MKKKEKNDIERGENVRNKEDRLRNNEGEERE